MVKLHFNTTEEFEELFKSKKRATTDAIVQGIEQAVIKNRKTAPLFEITFQESQRAFEISLPQAEWANALESCLDHYHQLQEADDAIDTWKLLEAVKTLK